MISPIQLIWPLAFCVAGISGDIIMTQSPPVLSVSEGQTATITCTASASVSSSYVHWYQQKAGQKPTLLIYYATTRFTGTSDRFTGSYQSNTFTLSISNVQSEDVAVYYCGQGCPSDVSACLSHVTEQEFHQQHRTLPQCPAHFPHPLTTFLQKTPPTLTLLPPSPEEVTTKGTATLVCLADHFYPDAVEVEWKKDGATISAGVQTSDYLRASDNTYSVSSLLTLSGSDWESPECPRIL
uniref:immunoglobulin lambda-1 light chain-like n=1 Tax=Pristiophorus japonicus TaxID=55135 RepID=UPI00398F2071